MRNLYVLGWLQLWCCRTTLTSRCLREDVELDLARFGFLTLEIILMRMYIGLLQKRVELIECAYGEHLGAQLVSRVRDVATLVLLPLTWFECDTGLQCWKTTEQSWRCRMAIERVPCSFVLACTAEAAWAYKVLARFRCEVVVSFSIICFLYLFPGAGMFSHSDDLYNGDREVQEAVLSVLVGMCEMAFVISIVGFFQPHQAQLPLQHSTLDDIEVARQAHSWPSPRSHHHDLERKETVEHLAERSIDVESLLQFYFKLGSSGGQMPHFSREFSTTNDVVRQAVIPMTRTHGGGGTSYACFIKPNVGSELPSCMVSHTWTNSFTHFVGAVIADALGEEEYCAIVGRLCGSDAHRQLLMSEVVEKRVSHKRYWICAFCVNQHRSICDSLGREPPLGTEHHRRWDLVRRDSVTHEVFPLCNCGQAKHLNNSPSKCELDKFDEMMSLLSRRVPQFRLLVAVDASFAVFTRAWCVAELVEAYNSRIPIDVCLLTNKSLDVDAEDLTVYTKLATLTVEECEASRPEDKIAILAKIRDVQIFDTQLQMAVFGDRGLLRQRLVGFGVLEAAAYSARRIQAVAHRQRSAEDLTSLRL
eukprot:TRINITY_DN46381_c0_g1_i2.p1 TRINITY_DN46381_c0_g1~~TRINITY_DN46381_c0_g1_i2.p1  ORF type:complete len:691 (-),score=62.81 TRINITY_DN46381_c0_g1_i2:302-2068(-)